MFRTSTILRKAITPLADRVLIQRATTAKETKSGILIPEQAVKKSNEGTVLEVGPGTKDWTMNLKKGDTVILPEYGGTQVKMDDNEYFLFRESEVLAVVRD
eukprot:TRINITY_DN8577_c0_g1_i1.p2 TRINITY_DN8577_c0_g1~~TRINITY_DN8577_c0_g1_i1.p2  ORF type:complete len:101 (-),score=21.72 TRINITY_DN8577_c0_g1_i1:86-388(-)